MRDSAGSDVSGESTAAIKVQDSVIRNCLKCGSHFEVDANVAREESENPQAGFTCPVCIDWQALLEQRDKYRHAAEVIKRRAPERGARK